MPRSSLPQNYIIHPETAIESLDTLTGWVQGLSANGTMTVDTTHVQSGTGAIRLTVTSAGQSTLMGKAFSNPIQFTTETLFHLWFFVPDYPVQLNIYSIALIMTSYSSDPTLSWSDQVSATVVMTNVSGSDCVPGWNHLCVRAGNFYAEGQEVGANWSRPMTAMKLRVYTQTGKTGYVTFDSFSYAQETTPRCLLTFDDGYDSIYTVAYAKMNPLGLRGTLYLNKSIYELGTSPYGVITESHLQSLYDAGWSIGNHCNTHVDMSTLSQSQIEDELMICYEWLVSMGWSRAAKHVAWPFGNILTSEMQAACQTTGMITARSTFGTSYPQQYTPVDNLYELKSHCLGIPESLTAMKVHLDKAIRNQGTVNFFGHALEDGHGSGSYWGATDFNGLIDYIVACKISCVTIDEWYKGLINPRYASVPSDRKLAYNRKLFYSDSVWKLQSTNSNVWNKIIWVPELEIYVAVAETGASNRVMTSPDGENWTTHTVPNRLWTAVEWSPELRLLVMIAYDYNSGYTDTIMTSPDGINWTARQAPAADYCMYDIAWSPKLGIFCIVCQSALHSFVSSDGVNWESVNGTYKEAVLWVDELNLFVAVGESNYYADQKIATSPDGRIWTNRSTPNPGRKWEGFCWASGLHRLVAVAKDGAVTSNVIITSDDAITWTGHSSPNLNKWRCVRWIPDAELLVAHGYTGVRNRCMTSLDGFTWTERATPSDADLDCHESAWSPKLKMLAVTSNGGSTHKIMTSTPLMDAVTRVAAGIRTVI